MTKRTEVVRALSEKFTLEEQSKIAFVPLIIAHIAWTYAFRTIQFAADHRLEEVKKLSRAVRHVREEYISELQRSLDQRHIKNIANETDAFMAEYGRDFLILYLSTSNSINRLYKHIEYDELRTNAFLAMQFVKACRNYENRMTKFIKSRIGVGHQSHLPSMSKLYDCMDAYLGDYEITETQDLKNAMAIFDKNLSEIEFNLNNFL